MQEERSLFTIASGRVSALWSQGPIAINMQEANDQHYEVPPAFFQKVLGPNLKYSCCWFDNPQQSLEAAERGMLQLTCERADLRNGQAILELGCGWGSLYFMDGGTFSRISNHRSLEFKGPTSLY